MVKKYPVREYKASEVVWFRKTKEYYGGFSNMCSGYPIKINGYDILSSEALYQACRFPDFPDIQKLIIEERSPMTAKMKSKPYRFNTRKDWDSARVNIMRWVLHVKLAQNFIKFGNLLKQSNPKQIVEDSKRDSFWGAVREKNDDNIFVGVNALGRLLMELRQKYLSVDRLNLLVVEPLKIENFKLFGEDIQMIDERNNFNFILDFIFNNKKMSNLSHEEAQYIIKQLSNSSEILDASIRTSSSIIDEPLNNSINEKDIVKNKIMLILKFGGPFSAKELVERTKVDWSSKEMTSFLKSLTELEQVKGSPVKFRISQSTKPNTLFDTVQ